MVKSCSAYGCTNRFKKESNIHFHKFPIENPELCKSWTVALKRDKFTPSKYSFLCSEHFAISDYVSSVNDEKPHLNPCAIPSIFDFPERLKKIPKSRKPPTKRAPVKRKFEPDDIPSTSSTTTTTVTVATETLSPPSKKSKPSPSPTKTKLRRKIKTLKQKLKRKEKKIECMNDLIKTLKEKNLLSEDCGAIIEYHFSGMTKEIIKSELINHNRDGTGKRYSDEIKKFALTLHFYSPRAYDFLRSIFSLPAPSSISNWTNSVNCEPGFFKDVFEYLSQKSTVDENYRDCALIFDAIHLKSGLVYEHSRGTYDGFVNFGKDIVGFDEDKIATEAMVFMLVGLKGHWKCPIGYVLENGLNATNLHTLTRNALQLAFDYNLTVHTVTCDGTNANLECMRKFGCEIGNKVEELNGLFEFNDNQVFFTPDACHMLKLARNALADVKEFRDEEGRLIKWKHLQVLHSLQEKEGLKFANKLSKSHVQFHRHKMNVRIAAQTLSSSVADALQFLMDSGHTDCSDAAGTIKFIRVIDRLFDTINVKSLYGKGFKKPLFKNNFVVWNSVINESIHYLSTLTNTNNIPLLQHRRKTFILGMIINARSILSLGCKLLNRVDNPFKYVLTYKTSQDHLELLFACIRGKNGFNSNPNVRHFKSSLRRILLRNAIVGSKHANCLTFEPQSIGSVFSLKWNKRSSPIHEDTSEDVEMPIVQFDSIHFSFYKESILGYISGFIVRRIIKKISCVPCSTAIQFFPSTTEIDHSYPKFSNPSITLIASKNRGGLVKPSTSVFKIVSATESCIKSLINFPSKLNKNTISLSVNQSLVNPFP